MSHPRPIFSGRGLDSTFQFYSSRVSRCVSWVSRWRSRSRATCVLCCPRCSKLDNFVETKTFGITAFGSSLRVKKKEKKKINLPCLARCCCVCMFHFAGTSWILLILSAVVS